MHRRITGAGWRGTRKRRQRGRNRWTNAATCTPAYRVPVEARGEATSITHGSVVIAAITSCTNTSNPSVMIGAGLLAKKAVEHGLRVPAYVKTSLAPGSRVVTRYLQAAGLTPYLQALGFHAIGYGCTTCIGKQRPYSGERRQCHL